MKKRVELGFFILSIILICLGLVLADLLSSDSTNLNEWRMFGRNNNHSGWDGVVFSKIPGLNYANYTAGGSVNYPAVANGYVYVGSSDSNVYQLNASNVSQLIATYTTGGIVNHALAIANGYVYVGSNDNNTYQLNASNISQQIANYTTGGSIASSPAVANGYVYVGSNDNNTYQLNASNISQQIANYTTGGATYHPAVANGYVYVGSSDSNVYQLNASNVSQLIATYTTAGLNFIDTPSIANGYFYIGGGDYYIYQLNASNVSQQIANYTAAGLLYSPAVANGYVYVGGEDFVVFQLNASNVSQQIANYTAGEAVYYPVVANGYVYVGSDDLNVYQLNASNVSQLIATYTTIPGAIISYTAVANGYVYVGSSANTIYQLNAENISLTTNDFIAPNVSFVSPTNQTYTTSTIRVNISNSSDTSSVWWYNGTANLTYTSSVTLTLSNGDYTFIAYANDSSGNLNSTPVTFNVNVAASSADAAAQSSSWGDSQGTYIVNEQSLKEGSFYSMHISDKIKFAVNSTNHTLTLNQFNSTIARVTINSNPIVASLEKNTLYQFNVDNDSLTDIILRYNGINKSKAIIFIQSLQKNISSENDSLGSEEFSPNETSNKNNLSFAIVIIFILVIVIYFIIFLRRKSKRHHKK